MVANSLFLTIAILLALGFWLSGQLKFFIPYKTVLFHEYGTAILIYQTVPQSLCSGVRSKSQVLS